MFLPKQSSLGEKASAAGVHKSGSYPVWRNLPPYSDHSVSRMPVDQPGKSETDFAVFN